MTETYRIEHIADLLLIPADRVGEALADLEMALGAARLVMAVAVAPGRAASPRAFLPYIEWTDDGKREATAKVNGVAAFTIAEERA